MSRDIGVTVTRDSRVSHATTTTPHHTYITPTACIVSTGGRSDRIGCGPSVLTDACGADR